MAHDIHSGEHRGESRRGRDVGAESVLEQDAFAGNAVDVRGCEPMIPIATQVIGS